MKNVKIPQGYSEVVNKRRSDNTMTKRKTAMYQTLHTKLKIDQHEPQFVPLKLLTKIDL